MRILFGCMIVLLLAIPTHAYLPMNCISDAYKTDYTEATDVVIGQVAGFERVIEKEKHKNTKGEEYEITVFSYFAKVQIARALTGKLKEGDEILVIEGYGEQWTGKTFAQSHWIKQCNTHARAGMQLGTAYIFALNEKESPTAPKTWYQLRSCHRSLHELSDVENEESGKRWIGVKIAADDDGKKPAHYVTVDAFIEHMKKLAAQAPAK